MAERQRTELIQPSLLYRIVFQSRLVLVVVIVLMVTFIIHPVMRVEASEDTGGVAIEELDAPVASVVDRTDIPLPPIAGDGLLVDDREVVEASILDPEEPLVAGGELYPEFSTSTPRYDAPSQALSATTSDVQERVIVAGSSSSTITTSLIPTPTSPRTDEPEASSSDMVAPADSSEVIATSTLATDDVLIATTVPALATPTPAQPLIHETYSDAELRFLRRDCVVVDGGSYYCQVASSSGSTKDALIAEPDSDGDLEIFLVKDGEYHQLTYNDVDDAAPQYDGRSQTMVWHRYVGDAYVIYEYDFETGVERALSRGLYNDMEPTRFGDRTVWQRWVDGRWQVMLYEDDRETQLTTADAHHLAPIIRGEIIMWQTVSEVGDKQIETLDLLTGTYQTINDPDTAALANPRMMMVYEAVFENGDVVTRGFDLKTGQIVALDATPAELPDSIPDSDTTGETRALINAKTNQKEGERESDDEPLTLLPPLATSSDPSTLDLRAEPVGTTSMATTTVFSTSDLIIEPLVETTSTE